MASSLLVATAVVDMLAMRLKFLVWVWEAHLDARFLTMVAVLKGRQYERNYISLCFGEPSLRTFGDLLIKESVFRVLIAHEF